MLSKKGEQYDFIMIGGDEKPVIAMEFKLHEATLPGSLLRTIFQKLETKSMCRVGIVVGLHFAAALVKKENWAELPSYYSLYSISRVKGEGTRMEFKKHFPFDEEMSLSDQEAPSKKRKLDLEPKEAPFIVILISLLELNLWARTRDEFLEQVYTLRG